MLKKVILILLIPIYLMTLNAINYWTEISYFWITILWFNIPTILISILIWKDIVEDWKAILYSMGIFFLLTTIWEFASTDNSLTPSFNIWSFDSKMIGYIFDIPIEEFIWWNSSSLFIISLYLYIKRIINGK